MPYDMYYIEECQVLLVTARGTIDNPGAKKMGLEMTGRLREHNCGKLLVDLREMDIEMPTEDIYEVSSQLDRLGLRRNDRVAHLISHDWAAHRLFETVALNRGFAIAVFEDYERAMRWLGDDRHPTSVNCLEK